jgi:hypothetical protein
MGGIANETPALPYQRPYMGLLLPSVLYPWIAVVKPI